MTVSEFRFAGSDRNGEGSGTRLQGTVAPV